MPSTRSKNILMALLPLVAAGVAWVVMGMGGDEAPSDEVNVSISIGEGGAAIAGRGEERLDQAVRDQAPEPGIAPEQRRESAASAVAGEVASPWVSRVPRDARWIRGRVEFPGETPADEELWVIAEGARFFENDDSPRRHRGKVEQDGRFAVAVGARTPRKAKLWVRGRYLYLAEPEYVELAAEEEVVLEPLVGGCLEVTVLPPTALAFEQGVLDDVEVSTDLGRFRQAEERAAVRVDESTFVLGGLSPSKSWTVEAVSARFAGGKAADISVEPGSVEAVSIPLAIGVTVAGTVVDALGDPVEDAQVEVHDGSQPEIPIGVDLYDGKEEASRRDGSFSLRGVRPGPAILTVTAEGYLPYRFDLGELGDGFERTGLVARLEQGNVVAGFVQWPDGEPVAGAVVRISQTRRVFGDFSAPVPHAEVLSGADGSFTFPGLTEGVCDIAASAIHPDDQPDPTSKLSRLKAKKIPRWIARQADVEPGNRGVSLTLTEGEAVQGRVQDDLGKPIKNFSVVATPTAEGLLFAGSRRPIRARFSDENGSFALEGLLDGTWDIRVNATAHAESPVQSAEIPVGRVLKFVLPRAATIAGVVLDPSGEPISRAEVEISEGPGSNDTEKANSEGEFKAVELKPGRVGLTATAEGYASSEEVFVDVAAGDDRDGVTLMLRPGAIIRGVLHPEVEPRSGRSVRLMGPEGARTTTDSSGSFRFDSLDPGSYTLELREDSSGRGRREDDWILSRMERSELEVEIAPGEDVSVVLGEPPPDRVRVLGRVLKRGEPVTDTLMLATFLDDKEPSAGARTDSDGRFEMVLDKPGTWEFRKSEGWRGAGALMVADVPPGETCSLELVLPEARLVGQVTDSSGSPVSGMRLALQADGSNDWFSTMSATTDEMGQYTFDELREGEYRIRAGSERRRGWAQREDSAYATETIPVTIEGDDGETKVDIRLRESGSVEGFILSGSGVPIPGANVVARDSEGNRVSSVRSRADGSFTLGGLAGKVDLSAEGVDGYESGEPVSVDVPEGGVTSVDLVMLKSQ